MRRQSWVIALLLSVFTTVFPRAPLEQTVFPRPPGAGSNPSDIIVCDAQNCVSEARLATFVEYILSGNVVGYVLIVGGLPPVSSGWARATADAPATAMSASLVTNLASISKVLTTIGVLQSMKKHNISLDTTISSYIYSDWTKGANVDKITFKELLTHTSGFTKKNSAAVACEKTPDYAHLEALIASDVSTDDLGKTPDYNNCNFAIFRELLPAMEGRVLNASPDSRRAADSASLYISYMNQNVFQPLGIPSGGGWAQCRPPGLGTAQIFSYPFPSGSAHGDDWGDWTLICGGGGWVLSANDLFKVVSDLANGNVLLTAAEKMDMNTDKLGWDTSVRSDCPDPNFCKNGGLNDGDIKLWTYAGIFKNQIPVVLIVNSPLPSDYSDIINLVADAYKAAVYPVCNITHSCPIARPNPNACCRSCIAGGGSCTMGGPNGCTCQ